MTFLVACPVGGNLLLPECATSLGPPEEMAIMAVPEASVNQDDAIIARQYDVRLTRKISPVEAESDPTPVQG